MAAVVQRALQTSEGAVPPNVRCPVTRSTPFLARLKSLMAYQYQEAAHESPHGGQLNSHANNQADGMPTSCSSSTFLAAAVSCTSGLAKVI